MKKIIFSLLMVGALAGCFEIVEKPKPDTPPPVPEVSSGLLGLIHLQETQEISAEDYPSTSLNSIFSLATPMGYRLKLRTTEISVPLVEALKLSRDRELLSRLFEMAQWAERPRVRAEALVTLGSFNDPADYGYFSKALIEKDVGIRCAAIEALQIWGQEGSIELLKKIMADSWSPVAQVFAAQALLSLGEPSGLPVLYQGLESRSWIIRALSARYLGDYADPKDSTKLLSLMNSETRSDFVVAEAAIAALKLLSRAQQEVSYSPASKTWRENEDVHFWMGPNNGIEVEPLVILPPRLFLGDTTNVISSINNKLLYLIKDRLDLPLAKQADQNNPDLQDLYKLVSPTGLAIKTRYTSLSYLVAEGLAGTRDLLLRAELERLAQGSKSALTRATAILSLAYSLEGPTDFITMGLGSEDPVVRFGSMEAVLAGRMEKFIPDLISISYNDPLPAFRIFALGAMAQFGNPTGMNLLSTHFEDPDWTARSLAFWYLGRYGSEHDYISVMNSFGTEDNPFVKAEMILAAQRLTPLR